MSHRDTYKVYAGGQINMFNGPNPNESRTDSLTMKCTSTEKQVFQEIANQQGCASSEFMRAAAAFYIEFHDHAPKLIKYKEVVVAVVNSLP